MKIDEAIMRVRVLRALLAGAAASSEYFGRKEDAEMHRNDIAALDLLIDEIERRLADED